MELFESTTTRVAVEATLTRIYLPHPTGVAATIRGYEASLGSFAGQGRTAKEAKDVLAAQVEAGAQVDTDPVVVMYGGYVSVAWQVPSLPTGWTARTYAPDGSDAGTYFTGGDRTSVRQAALFDLCQRATDWHSDDSVARAVAVLPPAGDHDRDAFLRYAAWQRAARSAQDLGRTDWHEWATRHASEFTPTLPTA